MLLVVLFVRIVLSLFQIQLRNQVFDMNATSQDRKSIKMSTRMVVPTRLPHLELRLEAVRSRRQKQKRPETSEMPRSPKYRNRRGPSNQIVRAGRFVGGKSRYLYRLSPNTCEFQAQREGPKTCCEKPRSTSLTDTIVLQPLQDRGSMTNETQARRQLW